MKLLLGLNCLVLRIWWVFKVASILSLWVEIFWSYYLSLPGIDLYYRYPYYRYPYYLSLLYVETRDNTAYDSLCVIVPHVTSVVCSQSYRSCIVLSAIVTLFLFFTLCTKYHKYHHCSVQFYDLFFSSVYFLKRLHIIIRKERKGNPPIVVLIIIESESEQNRVAGLLVMKEKDATFLIKSMISEVCSSPDLSVSKNLHKKSRDDRGWGNPWLLCESGIGCLIFLNLYKYINV